jgi:threonine synthase
MGISQMNHADKYSLTCPVCSKAYPPASDQLRCTDCDAPTVVAMNTARTAPFEPSTEPSMWRYFDLLPLSDRASVVSQGEGQTPLMVSTSLADHLGVGSLLLKNETVNPTGSFKDRQVSLSISKAKESGAHTLAVISSGNVAAAAASYAAIAGLTCIIFAPHNAAEDKLVQARMYGASFVKVNTLSSSQIFELVAQACPQKDWYLLSTAGLYNPYHVEGAKTIAYELFEQCPSMPDWVIAPVGGGGLIGALWRGFNELVSLGKLDRPPAIVGVQSSQCTPLIDAIEKNLSPAEVVANPVEVGDTIAGAIADDILFDAYTALPAIRESGGKAVSITDDEMLEAELLLARKTGIFAEPASASTIAAIKQLRDSSAIGQGDSVCCIITGSGFKDLASAKRLVGAPAQIEATIQAFLRLD